MTDPKSVAIKKTDMDREFDALVCEVSAKLESGQSIDLDALADEFPQHTGRLRKLLPTLKAIAFELAAFLPLIMIWQVKSIKQRLLLGATVVSIFAAIYFTYQPFKKYWDMKGATRQKQMIEQRVEKARESNQRIDADSE